MKKIQMSSNTKCGEYKYKSVAQTLENSRGKPYTSKHHRVSKIVNSHTKTNTRSNHFISAQKCDDGSTKLKLFAERRISSNMAMLSNKMNNNADC